MARKLNYQEASYWQTRYKQNICEWFEWLCTPNQLTTIFEQQFPMGNLKILELGCGSSNLSEKLITMGHSDITCVDYSKEVIKNKQRGAKEGIQYKYHDILEKLPFGDEEFDVILEKNTLDCLFCFDDFPGKVFKCMKECYRVLKEGGKMISISQGKQKSRRFFYRSRFSPFNLKWLPLSNRTPNQPQVSIFVLSKGEEGQNEMQEEQHENDEENEKIEAGEEKSEIKSQRQQDQQPQQQGEGEEEQKEEGQQQDNQQPENQEDQNEYEQGFEV